MDKNNIPAILITGGDPAGISPEIIEGALLENFLLLEKKSSSSFRLPIFIYFSTASSQHKENIQKICEMYSFKFTQVTNLNFQEEELDGVGEQSKKKFTKLLKNKILSKNFIYFDVQDVTKKEEIQLGIPSITSGALAFQALELACDYALKYPCHGLLTAPLSKEWVVRSGQKNFRGHTEYLAERFNKDVLMLLHGEKLSVIPLTIHIALNDVPKKLKEVTQGSSLTKLIPLLKMIHEMPTYENTKWALCALNPHAGEGGYMGAEEAEFLNAFSETLNEAGLPLSLPLASDALFMSPNRERYRLFLSCYHDQGLIPFKALEGDRGINTTIGLPILRTSPDHGTAFHLAGRELASCVSMSSAFRYLLDRFF